MMVVVVVLVDQGEEMFWGIKRRSYKGAESLMDVFVV